MSDRDIPFGSPILDNEEISAVSEVLGGTTLVHGPVTRRFEEEFAARAGAKRAVSLSSCTAGLHLSLLAQGIAAGDEVVVPAMTHVATAHAVEYCGARPIFADVGESNGNIDPAAVADAVGADTRAIMVVHYLGLPCEMERIGEIAESADAFIVEDCALAVDATYDGRKAGTLGLTGCFSFYPIKHMTTIEGGMVTTNDEALADRIAQRKAFGYDRTLENRVRPGIYDVTVLGYNYRMNEVQAAVGLAQLKKLDRHQIARADNYQRLSVGLAEMDELTVFEAVQGKAKSSHYCLNAVLPRDGSISRDVVVQHLKERGVGSSVHYPCAVPLMQYYREKYGHREGQFPVAEWLAEQTISLPVGPHLRDDDPEYIAAALKASIHMARA
ncbi:MAG: DegT/DnrJ/EryC1/StrS family aminotransferase [Rhodospirillales bacterium]|nr:DegT/DnrJ/EryC1/StrS family aminotransferase [Rhodospirillales bacterium]